MKAKTNQIISVLIMIIMLATNFSMIAEAILLGDATISKIQYTVNRDRDYNVENVFVSIMGSNLGGIEVRFETTGGIPPWKEMGTIHPGSNIVQYQLTPQEAESFSGKIMIEGKEFDLGLSKFPTVDSSTRIVNTSEEDSLVIKGKNLNNFGVDGDFVIKGEYGKAGKFEEFGVGNTDSTTIEIPKATPAGERGLQNIRIIKEKKPTASIDPDIEVIYNYNNVFSFVSDLNISDMEMYPNIGSKGDFLYIRSEDFDRAYDVYFFSIADASTEGFSNKNKAVFKSFTSKSAENPKAVLTVEVPQGIDLGGHYVILAETINGQVVAQQRITKDGTPDIYTVIDATYRPQITKVYPESGADIGGTPVGIEGKNILSSSFSPTELAINYTEDKRTVELSHNKQEVTVSYQDATYKGKAATVERTVKVQIGGIANFEETEEEGVKKPRVDIGAKDILYVITPKVDDAATNPYKDVLAEIRTIIKVDGEEYVFQEIALWNKKFTYEPSSIIPSIETATPSKIQIEENEIKKDTLVSIHGKNFMVNRYINQQGETIVNYPKILIKTANNIDTTQYELMLEKQIKGGIVTAKASWKTPFTTTLDEGVEIIVLDEFDRVVDGTTGREVGNRIIVKIPKGAKASPGVKNLQIANPTRESDEPGLSDIQLDKIEFVTAIDNPFIDEVVPDTITVDGGQDIEVKGSNFLEGIKVFIDGKEVPGVSREIASGGNKFVLKFKAPKGRKGITQLMVMNPSGAMDAADFIYVETLDKDPKITSFAPNNGSNGTLVVVKGDNFLKPDPTTKDISGNGIYSLIGTRILLDGKDINSYYKEGNNIALQDYTAPGGQHHQLIQKDGIKGVKLANYYHSILLYEEAGNQYYTIDMDTADNIILSDGVRDTYRIVKAVEGEESKFVATKGGTEYTIDVKSDILTITKGIENTILKIKTPYAVEDNIIIGNRVHVISKMEMQFTVPMLGVEKWYNLSVQNPDTKTDTKTGQNGFYYFKQPQRNPVITEITPPQGSTEGGYAVDIEGLYFQDYGGGKKSRVIVGGVYVPEADTTISTDGTKITIIMPRYPGDLKTEVENGRKTVPVAIVNTDGGNTYKLDGFTYVIPTSNPTINRVVDNYGNAAGRKTVRIHGTDFRYFEPYEDANGNAKYDEGEKFQDINENGKWDDIEGKMIEELSEKDKKILPFVYFGKQRAEILEFDDGYLLVSLPTGTRGVVDVFLVNNDFGTSNKVKFTYEASNPNIKDILPPDGKKTGGDKREINGSEFSKSFLHIYNEKKENGKQQYDIVEMPLVHFGDVQNPSVSNRNIGINDLNGGGIISGRANVEVGNITVDYQSTANSTKVVFQMKQGTEVYSFQIDGYDNTVKYIDTSILKNASGDSNNNSYELVRLEVDPVERKLIVERGYAPYHPKASMTDKQIVLYTPSYYTIGKVPVRVINPDGGIAQGQYEYKNPDSDPIITNITRNGESPVLTTVNGREMKILKMTYKDGNIISVIGEDFREATVYISNVAKITSFTEVSSNKLTFTLTGIEEDAVGGLHAVRVSNSDGGSAESDDLTPPIYIEFIKGESDPSLGSITPDKGLVTGETIVKIIGNDFRKSMEGFEGQVLKVFFGESVVDYVYGDNKLVIEDHKTLSVTVPKSSKPGVVDVRVENPDGSPAIPPLKFTYISKPEIKDVNPKKIFTNDTQTEITITGEMFMPGAKVVLGGETKEKDEVKSGDVVHGTGIYEVRGGKNIERSVVGGVIATSITVVDDKTIKVKFPEAFDLKSSSLIIINPDGGISKEYDNFKHELPIPTKPLVLEAIPGYESTVQLVWSDSSPEILNAADRYEVYAKLSSDKNYTFVGDTKDAEFLIKGLEVNTRYDFMVRALNRYGSALEFAEASTRTLTLREDDKLQDKIDELDKIADKLKKEGKEEIIGGAVIKTIGTEEIASSGGLYTIDFSLSKYKGRDKFIVALPVSILPSLNRNLMITDGKANLTFHPRNLYTREAIEGARSNPDDAYVRVVFERVIGQEATKLQTAIPRTKQRASGIYGLDFQLQTGKNITNIRQMLQPGSLSINFDSRSYPNAKKDRLNMTKYDISAHQFTNTGSGNYASPQMKSQFMLLSDR